jgi:hypothetical protein
MLILWSTSGPLKKAAQIVFPVCPITTRAHGVGLGAATTIFTLTQSSGTVIQGIVGVWKSAATTHGRQQYCQHTQIPKHAIQTLHSPRIRLKILHYK